LEEEQQPAMMTRSLSMRYDQLLTDQQMNQVKDRFNDDSQNALDEAIRKHHNIVTSGIPVYFWALLVFFAADNILGWFYSPFLFYPMAFLATVFGVVYAMGMGDIAIPLVKQFVNMQLRRFNLGFQV
jgi:hypothetical protein